ncbi:MAG: L-histidine N(alpha)-methyltransferase [Pseudomonadota bacterium]
MCRSTFPRHFSSIQQSRFAPTIQGSECFLLSAISCHRFGFLRYSKTGFFPGSTIGNVASEDATKLLARARRWSGTERFILGVDLVKDQAELISAYDDVQGITAAFIGNILHRMKRELDADIDAETFRYNAEWNDVAEQIEMSLIATKRQTVTVGRRSFPFEEGERLQISTSRKFTRNRIETLAQAAGWALEDLLTDDRQTVAIAILR